MHIDIQRIINLIVDYVWSLILTPVQQEQFTALANDANSIVQNLARVSDENFNRMVQIDNHQETNDPFGNTLFNGTKKFHDKNDFESLILTSGSSFSP